MTDVDKDADPDAVDIGQRALPHWLKLGVSGLAVFISVVHMVLAFKPLLSELERNAFHFGGFALLCAIVYPMSRSTWSSRSRNGLILDLAIGLLAAGSAIYLSQALDAIYDRGTRLAPLDWVAITIVILAAIELTRRTTGFIIPTLIVLAITYVTMWGSWIGGVFSFRGLSWETTYFRSIYGDDALFGTIASISSTTVFLFIIFGAFLVRSGAGEFVVDFARSVAGRLVGGPGLVAVVASGLTGTISGSAIANTASTGVITIPLMQKAGFRGRFAAGVEAASSTGGQLMPPIMGAGAFVMATLTQISYEYIVVVAALPALLYFLSVAFFVRIEAMRIGMQPMAVEDGTLWRSVKDGGASFIIPIALLIGMLVSGYSPNYAAGFGMLAVIASSWLTKRPMGFRAIYEALEMGARNMIVSAVLLCSVGLVINVIVTAGVGNTFSLMIASWSGGNLLIAIVLIGLASLVLGMGLPVTAAYIVLATLSAPALAGMIEDRAVVDAIVAGTLPDTAKAMFMLTDPSAMELLSGPLPPDQAAALVAGLPLEISAQLRDMVVPAALASTALLSAHMIVFWLSQDSNVTPPVCLAAFTAAAIAKSPPMATGLQSWKLAKGLYIVPVLFAYTPLLSGDWGAAFLVFFFAVFGIYALAAGLQGCMERPLSLVLRAFALFAGVACLWPMAVDLGALEFPSLIVNLLGLAATVALFIFNRKFGPIPIPASN
ncbi:TRAP transporter permease [Sedimentitalea todarodis]|uniref:TRAP transporter fused permease subunit n=1 Tax=Sedimentitalea todarodis TaxID=1631240 RepID=A0ABU3VM78_9RHOB|nr:TRAP transporter fused permease subunit [Sedimentitalea todarodis]MDU9007213.1 TRAP transporter fused permease subunit [Sedimentitalea todarodis]